VTGPGASVASARAAAAAPAERGRPAGPAGGAKGLPVPPGPGGLTDGPAMGAGRKPPAAAAAAAAAAAGRRATTAVGAWGWGGAASSGVSRRAWGCTAAQAEGGRGWERETKMLSTWVLPAPAEDLSIGCCPIGCGPVAFVPRRDARGGSAGEPPWLAEIAGRSGRSFISGRYPLSSPGTRRPATGSRSVCNSGT
jgi:hypothetical protein